MACATALGTCFGCWSSSACEFTAVVARPQMHSLHAVLSASPVCTGHPKHLHTYATARLDVHTHLRAMQLHMPLAQPACIIHISMDLLSMRWSCVGR